MGRKSFKKHQKLYKMKGCSKNKKSRRHLVGGLAYTGNSINTQNNPFLAYTGGSNSADNISLPQSVDVMAPKNMSGLYGGNPSLPNTGPIPLGSNSPTNMGSIKYGGSTSTNVMKGGTCGACQNNVMTGGTCGACQNNVMTGGDCGCGLKKGGTSKQKGGQTINPQGLLGNPWGSSPAKWPSVDGISGNRNYSSYNDFKVDPQNALISLGANRPFLFGGKKSGIGGKKSSKGGRRKRNNKRTKRRRQRGGIGSNFLTQDFINLGRQIQYNMGSTYNALNGYPAPTQVLPWQGQLPRTPNLNTMRGAAL